jgi:aminoglycoside phosphotransferase (APT) family kinase protein
MPQLLGFEDGDQPLLILEDMLPDARWPPPWQPGDVDAVLTALSDVATAKRSGELPRLAEGDLAGWRDVADDPAPFLGLGIAGAQWLERSLPVLLEASESALLDGDALVHGDVRSDNLCLRDGSAVLLDWNHASIGNAAFDIAFWLPSLVLEGGPEPESFGVDEMAVFVAGFFAAQAGLPAPDGAPRVRNFQRAQLEVALPWACGVLGLPVR